MTRAASTSDGVFRVGPNAVIQMAAALIDGPGEAAARAVFDAAGRSALIDHPPESMIDQAVAADVHRAARRVLPADVADLAADDAGRRTARYLLAHRIPKAAQAILKALPPVASARLLLAAIKANAWTFCGSGRFSATAGRVCRIEIAANPLAMNPCLWHAAVFAELFETLVSARSRVREVQCSGAGFEACVFEVDLGLH